MAKTAAKSKKSRPARAASRTTPKAAGPRNKTASKAKPHKKPAVKTSRPTTKPVAKRAPTKAGAATEAAKSKFNKTIVKTPQAKLKPEKGTQAAAKAEKPAKAPKPISAAKLKRGRSVAEVASNVVADSKGYVFINGRRVRMISTKNHVASPKKSRAASNNGSAGDAPATAPTEIAISSIKTKLSRKELTAYRELLLTKRRELVGDLRAMETEALRSGGGNLSHMPIHMADIGTDTYDQDFMLGLAENERQQLREIDAALQRIEDSTYGVCQLTGKPIPKARLDAKPWAKYTIEAARQMEGQWGR